MRSQVLYQAAQGLYRDIFRLLHQPAARCLWPADELPKHTEQSQCHHTPTQVCKPGRSIVPARGHCTHLRWCTTTLSVVRSALHRCTSRPVHRSEACLPGFQQAHPAKLAALCRTDPCSCHPARCYSAGPSSFHMSTHPHQPCLDHDHQKKGKSKELRQRHCGGDAVCVMV